MNNNNFEYVNKSELDVCCNGETHTIVSNEVKAEKIDIKIEIMQSRQCVFTGDCLDYMIKICNYSKLDIEDAIFCDDIPEGLEYVHGSFRVNNKPEMPIRHPHSKRISYKFDKIRANSEMTVCFKTTVL